MSDDVVRDDVPAALRAGTGPRHAAPKKPLLTRLHMPAGKAIALAAMPTAVLMGMGFTPTLARAEDHSSVPNSQRAEEYKDCVATLEKDDASASPSPSASESTASGGTSDDTKTAKADSGKAGSASKGDSDGKGGSGSSDSGSGKAEPSPSPSASAGDSASGEASPTPAPSPSTSADGKSDAGGLLETIGDTLTDIFTGGKTADAGKGDAAKGAESSPSPSPSASASGGSGAEKGPAGSSPSPSPSPKASEGKDDDADKASPSASPSPSQSESAGKDADDCEAATKAVADGRDNQILLPEDPWILEASGLQLVGADYQGVVEVTTSSGRKKKVLKYVVSDATKIDDLHQIVHDKNSGKTYHVRSAKGKQSVITGGKTTMYTESISGNLFGLLPVTFSPSSPPPLNIPYIYFSHVKVVQAGQFGGTLTIPGMNQSIT